MKRLAWLFAPIGLWLSCGNAPSDSTRKNASPGGRLYTSATWIDSLKKTKSLKWSPTHGVTDIYFTPDGKTAWITDGLAGSYLTRIEKTGPQTIRLQPLAPDSFPLICKLNDKNQWVTRLKDGHVIRLEETDTVDADKAGLNRYGFKQRINKELFEGRYQITYCDDGKEKGEWVFCQDGTLQGSSFYHYFEPCVNGDCILYCDEMDIVFLSNIEGQPAGKWYCFKKTVDGLELWHIKSLEWFSNHADFQPEKCWIRLKKIAP